MKKLCLFLIATGSCTLLYGMQNTPMDNAHAELCEKVSQQAQPHTPTHEQLCLVFEERVHKAVQPKNNSIPTKPAQEDPAPYSFNKKWIAIRRAQIEAIKVEALSCPFPIMSTYPQFCYAQPVIPNISLPCQQTASPQQCNQWAPQFQQGFQQGFQPGIWPQPNPVPTPHYQPDAQREQSGLDGTTQSQHIPDEASVQEHNAELPSAEQVCFLLANSLCCSRANTKPIQPS